MSNLDISTANIASGSVQSGSNTRYWCFMCEKEFSKPITGCTEVYCPNCNCISELIEESDDPRNFRPYDAQRENSQTSLESAEQPILTRQASLRQQRQQPRSTQPEASSQPRLNIIYRGPIITSQTATADGSSPQNGPNDLVQARRNMRAQLNPDQTGIHQHRIYIIPIDGNALNPLLGGAFGMLNSISPGVPVQGDFLENIERRIIEEFLRNDPNRYGPPPAPEESVNRLKQVSYNEENCKIKDCSVCQEDFKNGENLLVMPCEHTFHKDCVKKWLSMHNSCPVCRKALEDRGQTDV